MAELYIKVQGLNSWKEGKYSVEPIDFKKLVENSERVLSMDFSAYDKQSLDYYYIIDEVSCRIAIPWELLNLFYGLNSEQKFSRIIQENDNYSDSKIIWEKSEISESCTIPQLFNNDEVKVFPYWMYKYWPHNEIRVNGPLSNYPLDDENKIERDVFERNELSFNPILLELFLRRVIEKIFPLNLFSRKDQMDVFMERALFFCEFAKNYHIRILFDTGH